MSSRASGIRAISFLMSAKPSGKGLCLLGFAGLRCKRLRSHIRDVINKCLSETQKMHIGVAIDDYMAAGELKD